MKRTSSFFAAACGATLLLAPHIASAQLGSSRFPGRPPDNAIRVTAQFQTVMPAPTGSEAEQETAKTKARARLYETAQRECEVLKGVFSGECKVINLNVSVSLQSGMPGLTALRMNINATYLITPKE